MESADLVIVGAGAAGLAAAIFAAETLGGCPRRIVLLESARKPGAKILISGGGRCNVTNRRVSPADYCGGPSPIVRSVLRAFDENRTLDWFRSLGVVLKLEPTGKYFPVTDKARTILDALLDRVGKLGVELRAGIRIIGIQKTAEGFEVLGFDAESPAPPPTFRAALLILATGGLSLPKSGSDGAGLAMTRRLGHTLIPTTPALTPLLLNRDGGLSSRLMDLAGLTLDMRMGLYAATGKRLIERTGSLLFTHFGLSGPLALDLSRHWLRARLEAPSASTMLCLGHPDFPTIESADAWLRAKIESHSRHAPAAVLREFFPERLAQVLGADFPPLAHLARGQRLELSRRIARLPLDVVGDRGYAYAEVTAGGVDLREIDPRTMASRKVPGLYLCGEMLDVDGRIGGFNFQWAWASGYLAGRAAAGSLEQNAGGSLGSP